MTALAFGIRRSAFGVAVALVCAGSAGAQGRDWPSERPPRPLAAREVKFPPYEFRTLQNGLQVIAVLHHEQPAVSLRLLVRAGGAQDPSEKPGVASLAATLLDQGTTSRNAQEIASTVDSVGGALGTGAGTDLSFVNAVFMKDSFDLALRLVSDIARNPEFAPAEIDRQRQQILSALQVSYDDPDYVSSVVFDRLVYGFHPYGRPSAGTPQSIARITRDDLVAFHKAYFAPNNAILAIVGDITAEEAFAGAERAFGDWPRNDDVKVAPPLDPPPPTRRVVVIDRPGAVQTEIRVGHVAVPRKHPDYMALDLASRILGGEGSNRLHRVLRSERGLTYGASADLDTLKFAGNLVAETDTRSDATGQVLRLIVEEFWRLQRERVGRGELQGAQDYLAGSFPLTIETPSAIALQVLNAVFFGLDLEELQTYRERVNAVTPDDVQRVARAYLKPDRLSIVLVGDASRFASQLAAAGFPQFERIPIGELDLSSADFRRPAQSGGPAREFVAARNDRFVPAGSVVATHNDPVRDNPRALVGRAIEAKGGLDRLRAIRTVRATTATRLVVAARRSPEMRGTTAIAYPDRFRVDLETPQGRVLTILDGEQGWGRAPQGESADIASGELRASAERDVLRLLLRAHGGELTARAVDEVTLEDGTRAPALEFDLPGQRVQLVLDPETSLVLAERYVARHAGADQPVEERFSDYTAIDGVMVPFTTTVSRNGRVVLERKVQSIAFNVTLPPDTFAKPS
ncbi:MAG TPA: insulinase family protein [Vicinamibacterales bacterium]|nr:insulinase family protein [Vicinamibacterales bacterium]